jgi:hypothetical protein
MATITLRLGKGSPLTNSEVDDNFSNLNTELGTKANSSALAAYLTTATAASTYLPLSGGTTTGTTILANAFRFYSGGTDGSTAYGDFRTNPVTGNTILSAKTGSLYFNYDHGTGGVVFSNGAQGTVGNVDASGNANFVGAITQNGSQVLHAANYNSYAPTLTGTGASGTWGISITGNAATVTSVTSSQVTTALGFTPYNATNPSGYITTAGARAAISVTGSGSYDSATGIITVTGGVTSVNSRTGAVTISSADVTGALGFTPYNATNPSGYITSSALSSYLPLSGGTIVGTLLLGASGAYVAVGSPKLTVFGAGATETSSLWFQAGIGSALAGFKASDSNFYLTNTYAGNALGTNGLKIDTSGNLSVNGNTVLHAGNYNSYAPTLTGTGASGTWNISISGNAATATSATTAGSTTYLAALGSYVWSASTNGRSFNSGIQTSFVQSANGYPSYGSVVRIATYPNDGATAELYFPYSSTYGGSAMQYRLGQYDNAGWTGWKTVLDNSNYSSYALPLSGGTLSGILTANGGIYAPKIGIASSNLADQVNGAPWYGLGFSDLNFGASQVPQFAGYYGLRIRTASTILDFGPSGDAGNINVSSGGLKVGGSTVLHAGNYSSYALPLSGGAMSGNITFPNDSANGIFNAAGNAGYRPDDAYGNTYMFNTTGAGGWYGDFSGYFFRSTGSSNWMTISGSATNSLVALQQNGNQVLHAGNYTGYDSHLRALGYPSASTDWNSLGNGYQNSILQVDPSNFASTASGPTAASYTYGTLLNFASMSSSQAQIYISHAGNDLIFRGGWNGNSWQAWNKVLTNQNYNSYSPTLTGGNASGTWGISISGNSASTSQRNFSGDLSAGQGRFTGWYGGGAATTLATEIGVSGGQGYILSYNRDTGAYGILNISASAANLQFSGSTINVSSGSLQQGGNQVLHAGNYTSYSPSLTGTGASGTWGISISGLAANTSQLGGYARDYFVYGDSNQLGSFNTFIGDGGSGANSITRSGFYRDNTSHFGALGIHVQHANNGGYAGQIAWDGYNGGNLRYRMKQAGSWGGSVALLDAGNYSSYALPIGGGTISGGLTVNSTLSTGDLINLGYNTQGSVATSNARGIEFHYSSNRDYWFGKRAGGWTQPLDVSFYTGIRYHAHQDYNGHRFYSGGYDTNLVFSVGEGDNNVRVANTLYIGGNTAIHAGNYTSYSPSLGGSGASGTWGIKSRSINAVRTVNSDFNSLSTAVDTFTAGTNYIPYGGSYNQPADGDHHYLAWGGIEGSSVWAAQIDINFYDDRVWFRRQYGSSWQAWRQFIHDGNYSSYALPLSGGTLSGTLTIGSRLSLFDDGNTHIHSTSGPMWLNASDGSLINLNVQTNGNARVARDFYVYGGGGGNYGNRLIVGNTDVSYSLQDTNVRPVIQAHGAYPVLSLNHTVTSNGSHGPTIQMTANGVGNQFVIGMNGTGTNLTMGYSSGSNWNPHNGISGYNGTSFFEATTDGYIGIGAPGNWGGSGNGHPEYHLHFKGYNKAATSHAALFQNTTNGTNNGAGFCFLNDYGNHSWGIVAEFRISAASDRPSILFSSGQTSTTWSVGYGAGDDQFRINQNHGHRNGGWGSERFRIDTGGTAYFNGNVALHAGNYTGYAASASHTQSVTTLSDRPAWFGGGSFIANQSDANAWHNSGFYENGGGGSNWPNGSGTWYNSINVRHSNQGNYHGFQLSMSYYDNYLYWRSYQGSGTFQPWVRGLSSQNYDQYAVNRGGDSLSGTFYFISNRNTSSDSPPLQAHSTNGSGAIMAFHRSGAYAINFGLDSDNVIRFGGWSAAANRLQMDMSGNLTMAGNVTAYSDERLKKDWALLPSDFIEALAQVKSGTYTRIDSDERQVGVSAQGLQKFLEEAVQTDAAGMLSVNYGGAALASAVELAKRVVDQEKRIAHLESLIHKLIGD